MKENALEWWRELTIIEKAKRLSDGKDEHYHLVGRKIESLTDTEILELYLLNALSTPLVWWRCEERTMHYTNCCSAFD